MFNAAEYQTIRDKCLPDFESFLNCLSIDIPDWNSEDEYKIYNKLDPDITNKLCLLMRSSSVYDGFISLLKLGDIAYDYSEKDADLLNKIVINKEKIISNFSESITKYDSWQKKYAGIKPGKEKVEILNIKCSDAKRFNTKAIVSKFENIKSRLKNTLNETSFRGLERTINIISNSISQQYEVVSKLEGFLTEIVNSSKSSNSENINDICQKIDNIAQEIKSTDNLFEVTGKFIKIEAKDMEELIYKVSNQISEGNSRIICLEISKEIQWREKEIPNQPPKPPLDNQNFKQVLVILEKLNEITKLL